MPFPSLKPTSRVYNGGDYPVRTFKSQSGVEARILYGSRRTGMTLELGFDNIADASAASFMAHFDKVKGTFQTFTLPLELFAGWDADQSVIDAATGNRWRYGEQPSITNVRPGRSTVQVQLVGVL